MLSSYDFRRMALVIYYFPYKKGFMRVEMFTVEELRDIAARASTIDERLAGGYVVEESAASAEKAAKRVKSWCKSAADGDDALFRKRLARNSLDINSVMPLLGDQQLKNGQQTPDWLKMFSWAIDAIQSHSGANTTSKFVNASQPLPFEGLFVPLIVAARERRDSQISNCSILLSEAAHDALQHDLLRRLSELCASTLYEGFTLFQMLQQPLITVLALPSGTIGSHINYDAYIAEMCGGGLRDYFINRPVLARLLANITKQWIDVTAELIMRLDRDLAKISRVFHSGVNPGSVTNIDCALSDPHNGGRTVFILTFSNGLKLVYKPKDLGLDGAWYDLLCWLDAREAPISTKAPTVLQRQGYGWVDWIEPTSCANETNAKRFFHSAGSTLCLLYLLQGSDFHFENIIASGDQPVLVDLETLMHPWLADSFPITGPKAALSTASKRLQDSVLATGYLPNWAVVPGGRIVGVGGLSPMDLQEFKRWRFQDINTDSMKLEKVSEQIKKKVHLPSLNGEQLSSAVHCDEIVAGFEIMYKFLLKHRSELTDQAGPLEKFKEKIVRVVLRPTQLYSLLLRRSLENQNLSDGADWSLHFDFLSRFSNWGDDEGRYQLIQKAEREALANLDIPFFTTYTNVESLQLPDQIIIEKCFNNPSFKQTITRLNRLCETNLQKQIVLIRQALDRVGDSSNHRRNNHWKRKPKKHTNKEGLTPSIALDQAHDFAAILKHEAVYSGGGAAWIGAVPLPSEERSQLEVIGYDLFSGACGVALFLSALEHVTNKGNYHNLALAALAPLREELRDRESSFRLARRMGIGGGTGLGSVIYSLVRSSVFLNEVELLEDAKHVAMLITDERIATDNSLDVVMGAAGAILGLLTLFKECQDDFALERAIACGRHLILKMGKGKACKKAWRTLGDTPLTGFSHGAAGIALALLRLYQVTHNHAFLNAAIEGISYERSVFSTATGNWPDFRNLLGMTKNEPSFPCQWCHGAAGIGLARLSSIEILNNNEIQNEIDVALQTTIDSAMGASDHLCCGNFGRLEMLFTAGLSCSNGELIDLANYRATQLMGRAKKLSGFSWPVGNDRQNPGFFTGISGVGYQILRFAYPEILPSVLLWE